MSIDKIRKTYNIPAKRGGRVKYTGDHNGKVALPNYCSLGESKFAATERLAYDVKRYQWLKENSKDLSYWAVMKTGRHDVDAAIDKEMSKGDT